MTLFDWIAQRRRGKPSPEKETEAPQGLHIYASQPAVTAMLVTLIGVEDAHIDGIIAATTAKFAARHRIVYITDSLDFMRFRHRDAVFEYLPSILEQQLHAAEMAWDAYMARRWQLLLSKWKPLHIVSYGQNIDTFLAAAPRLATGGG